MEPNDTFDYKQASNFLIKKESLEKEKNFQLYQEATKDAKFIIDMIKQYNPQAIYQWGSLLHQEQFDINSDIDIAVEGIDSAEKFFELYGKAESMTEFSLDLIEIEKISEVHKKSIQGNGRIVYEK